MSHTLWIPITFPSLNELLRKSGHWRKTALSKQIQAIALLSKFKAVEKPAYYTYLHMEPNKRRDPGNFAASAQKVIEDGLHGRDIENGLAFIPGDGWGHILGFAHHWNLDPVDPGVLLIVGDRLYDHPEALQIHRSRANPA